MKCYECEEMLSAYMDEMLSDEERKEVERHLENCPSCTQSLEHLKMILEHLNEIEQAEVPDSLHKGIMDKINQETLKRKKLVSFKKWGKYAAGLAAALLIVFVWVDSAKMGEKTSKMEMAESTDMAAAEHTEIKQARILADTKEEATLAAEPPAAMAKQAATGEASMSAQASVEEWALVTSQKEKLIAAVRDYSSKNNLRAEYIPNEKQISSVLIYSVLAKDELLEVLNKADQGLKVTKKDEGGENLKLVIK